MERVPDRKKLRREYLKTKRVGVAGIVLRSIFLILVLSSFILVPVVMGYFRPLPPGNALPVEIVYLIGFVLVGSGWIGVRLVSHIGHQASVLRNLPVVPPVTTATFPADEILVRGAEEPHVMQSASLLRAAQRAQETPKEELLLMSQGD